MQGEEMEGSKNDELSTEADFRPSIRPTSLINEEVVFMITV